MLQLLASMDLALYAPRDYVLATTDHTSAEKIVAFEAERSQGCGGAGPTEHRLLRLPRRPRDLSRQPDHVQSTDVWRRSGLLLRNKLRRV